MLADDGMLYDDVCLGTKATTQRSDTCEHSQDTFLLKASSWKGTEDCTFPFPFCLNPDCATHSTHRRTVLTCYISHLFPSYLSLGHVSATLDKNVMLSPLETLKM